MSLPFAFILCSMATFTCALFVTKTDGPAWIFRKLRNAPPPRSSAREGLRCPWCTATWFALVWTACACFSEIAPWHIFVLWWFATTAGAIILNQTFTKDG